MLALSDGKRHYLYRHSTDMRKSFDGLSGIISSQMQAQPLSGDIFIFLNKRRNQLKLFYWNLDGFAIWYKRLERGTFELPVTTDNTGESMAVQAWQLRLILEGVQLKSITRRTRYKRPEAV
jgi:transposase